ncbi:MAG: sialidase family protein, partial [Ignavibacteriaceae bacterium]
YGAQQDAGTVSIISRSDFGEITSRDWYPIGAGESGYIVPDPVNSNIIYGGDTYGGLFRYDHVTGQSQVISPWLLSEFNEPMNKRKYRFTWTSPIDFDLHNNKALFFGSQFLLRTLDGGLHWEKVSPDLTYGNPEAVKEKKDGLTPKNVVNPGWGVIYSFAFSPIQKGMIWAGTDDGLIHLTQDNGKNWKNVTPDNLAPWSKISNIEASPFDSKTAFISVDRHRLDDFSPYIYQTKDNGQHWVRINNGIKNLSYVNVIRTDPYKKGLLYAGTETGVYVSFDDGTNWQPLQLNLPTVSVRDLAVHENDLVAATHGRAFWVLDDLTPLRQITEKVKDANAFLFQPETAFRIRKSENKDTPLPPEIPHGKNPPTGTIIDYYLRSESPKAISLDIFDQRGNLIRQFSSNDQPNAISVQPYFMPRWLPKFRALTKHAGLNRFVWDLRYNSGKGPAERPEGPLVLPGEYKITLSVGNKSFTRELKVVMDPRVNVTNKALTDQLQLAISIWNSSADKNKLILSVDSVSNQINRMLNNTIQDKNLMMLLNNTEKEVDTIKKEIDISSLSELQSAVLSADREPTEPMFSGYKYLKNNLSKVQKQWTEIKLKDLKKMNIELKDNKLQFIKIPSETASHIIFSE